MSRSRRPSLAETMQKAARPEPAAAPALVARAGAPAAEPEREGRGFYAATRAGKKKLTTAVDPGAHMQFRQLALELDKKGEALLIEAINDLFSKYGKPPIA
jgi:hypothetical protein